VGHGAQFGHINKLRLSDMPRASLIGRHLKSLDDIRTAAVQLRHALEDVGVTVAPSKVSEVIALLCGAPSHDELQKSLKGTPAPDRSAPSADVRLLPFPSCSRNGMPQTTDLWLIKFNSGRRIRPRIGATS